MHFTLKCCAKVKQRYQYILYIPIAVSFWYDSSIWGGMHFQTCFWAFSSRRNSAQVLLVMVVKHLKDIVSKTEKANLQPLLMVAFPFQQQQRMATQQKTICTFMVSFKGSIALLWHFSKCKNRKCQHRNVKIFSMNWAILSKFFFTFSIFTLCKLSD